MYKENRMISQNTFQFLNKQLLDQKVFLIALVLLSSCSSYKKIPYFQDLGQNPSEQNISTKPISVQPADVLAINVTSKNPEAAQLFNYNLIRVNGTNNVTPDNPVVGFRVDENGEVHLPLVGAMKVVGMTTDQIREKINTMLLKYYLDPVVNVRLINFSVSVYGDVLKPDVYTLKNEYTTVTQVLTLAGDLNITARRDNVLLIRYEDGKRKMIRLDLTSSKIFDSPYFQLKNNDEIYVQPDRSKFATIDRGNRSLGLILSGLSVIAIFFSTLYR